VIIQPSALPLTSEFNILEEQREDLEGVRRVKVSKFLGSGLGYIGGGAEAQSGRPQNRLHGGYCLVVDDRLCYYM
jgi:hypothetical protein